MQRLVNFIEDFRTTLAVEEEELRSLFERINSYTYVGEDPLDQAEQVSGCEGEAQCNSPNATEGCREKQHQQVSKAYFAYVIQPFYTPNKSHTVHYSPEIGP